MALINKIKQIWFNTMFHGTKTYFILPKTDFDLPDPQNEGPLGNSLKKTSLFFEKITKSVGHSTPLSYSLIGIILSIVTFIEFRIFYLESLGSVMIPLLIVLSLGKFILVVGFFMHLRFDNKILAYIFSAGFILATLIFVILMILQSV